jgi:hypothetical protein
MVQLWVHILICSLFLSFLFDIFLSLWSYLSLLRLSLVLHSRLPSLSLSREYIHTFSSLSLCLVHVTQCFALSFNIHFNKKKRKEVSFVFYLTTIHRSSKAVEMLNYLFCHQEWLIFLLAFLICLYYKRLHMNKSSFRRYSSLFIHY